MKKNIILIVIILFLLVAIGAGILLVQRYIVSNRQIDSGATTPIEKGEKLVTGYIKALENNCYVKYSGKFSLDNDSEKIQAVIEYTIKGKDYAMDSQKLGVGLVKKGDKLYSISHKYNMVVDIPLTTVIQLDFNLYSRLKNIESNYVGDGKETIDKINYIYEEYKVEDTTIKCYFVRDELKYIRTETKDNSELIKIEQIEGKANNDLFNIPETYEKH